MAARRSAGRRMSQRIARPPTDFRGSSRAARLACQLTYVAYQWPKQMATLNLSACDSGPAPNARFRRRRVGRTRHRDQAALRSPCSAAPSKARAARRAPRRSRPIANVAFRLRGPLARERDLSPWRRWHGPRERLEPVASARVAQNLSCGHDRISRTSARIAPHPTTMMSQNMGRDQAVHKTRGLIRAIRPQTVMARSRIT
jgi:hypothetical protein